MAICCRNVKHPILQRYHHIILNRLCQQVYSNAVEPENDTMDSFTSKYLEQKVIKWELKKVSKSIDTNKLEEPSTISTNMDVLEEITNSIRNNEILPKHLVVDVLSKLSKNGDKDKIFEIVNYLNDKQPNLLNSYSNFQHYIAEAIWIKGDVTKSLEIFERTYRENACLRRSIRLILSNLFQDVVNDRSEAALVNVIKFCQSLFKEYEDYYLLSCVWQACFVSEWYTDQCTALKLLEDNNDLCKAIVRRIPSVVFNSLYFHRVDVVYRLLEILLKYKMKTEYSTVLVALLDYQFRHGDLKSCSEIIQWSIENKVKLPDYVHVKIINKLLSQKYNTPLAKLKINNVNKNKFNLKF